MPDPTFPYVIRPGDYLDKLAARYGFDADEVWTHEKNKEVKELREQPNLLCPGDLLHLPKPAPVAASLEAETNNPVTGQVPKAKVEVILTGRDGPLRGVSCRCVGLDPETASTDGDGRLRMEVPVTMSHVLVEIAGASSPVVLAVGFLDPAVESTGIAARLDNLGFRTLEEFQRSKNLPATGQPDEETLVALVTDYGC